MTTHLIVYAELETITGFWHLDIPSAHIFGARHKGTLSRAVAEAMGVDDLTGYTLEPRDMGGDDLDYSA